MIEAVCEELRSALIGRRPGKIFPLGKRRLAIDFRSPESRYLFISVEPNVPRIYMVRRRLKDLERESTHPLSFHLLLSKHLSRVELECVEKIAGERVVTLRFTGSDDVGASIRPTLVVQLTGRSSNLFLLDSNDRILGSLTESDVDGQRFGERYTVPLRPSPKLKDEAEVDVVRTGSVSEALDRFYIEREAEERFRSLAQSEIKKIRAEISRRRKLIDRMQSDLRTHGDAEKWKRSGDLLLANLTTARREGNRVFVTDYFEPDVPVIEIEADENISLTHAAEKYFKRYRKAQNASVEIKLRIENLSEQIGALEGRLAEAEKALAEHNESFFEDRRPGKQVEKQNKRQKDEFTGARRFTSSDGFAVLVGKRAVDNDQLTFRVAGSLDLWLHAADYSGSHVVVRNPNRKEIPQRTLLEAAQLAAFYSSGKSQPKAAVNYTQKKFVNKPRGAAPGLVRLASFKTILVEPVIPSALDKKEK